MPEGGSGVGRRGVAKRSLYKNNNFYSNYNFNQTIASFLHFFIPHPSHIHNISAGTVRWLFVRKYCANRYSYTLEINKKQVYSS